MESSVVEKSPDVAKQDKQPLRERSQGITRVFTHYPTLVLLVLLCVFFSFATSTFFTSANLTNLVAVQAVTALVTFAALLPLIVGEFDLSLGYMVGIDAMIGAYFSGKGWSWIPVIMVMVAAGVLIGLCNGLLTVRFKISAFIGTLGVGIILSGFTSAISNGEVLFNGVPDTIVKIGRNNFLGLGISAWLVIVIAIILVYLLEHTPNGRRLYATGGSEPVAFLAGVRTGRMKIFAFIGAGVLVALASIFQLGQSGSASPSFGPELLLPAYAGAFLSVVSYRPGYFNVPGAIIAVLLLAVGFNGLSLMGVPFWGQPLFNGAVLLLAVLSARAESRHIKVG
jgi:ribose transport system permease protein